VKIRVLDECAKCKDCPQPIDDHCVGCCCEFQLGFVPKRFCGKKGNEVRSKWD